MAWTIELTEKAEKEIGKLGRQPARRITDYLYQRVATREDPRTLGKALTGSQLGGYWRYRVGDYRIICEIQDQEITVLVLKVGHRREIY